MDGIAMCFFLEGGVLYCACRDAVRRRDRGLFNVILIGNMCEERKENFSLLYPSHGSILRWVSPLAGLYAVTLS